MVRDGAVHPRWVLRRDERRAGRYEGDKVVRWIARPTLMKGRTKGSAAIEAEDGPTGYTPPSRPSSFKGLRIVSDT
ncbi:hypothetical protein [Methylobacterium sp. R2-1]|uniref:hypothetical protein n=1 Tax=Methylobacterium sp. R2-1 TaxID=2587064 RepID=UPI00160EB014|nr:hypothetical protein [Methylobacterium sp. R2-1]MBB2961023.1 hypothetical protein [Methylobacterium sp. R2-1]